MTFLRLLSGIFASMESNEVDELLGVRLQGGLEPREGRVDIYHQTLGWGSICKTGWDNYDAMVICRMLGYELGGSVSYQPYMQWKQRIK